ncbi:MAG: phosphatidylserine decarboxylase family protein [Chloroflexi bacterium]|nr:phosphatidylserine decarboxylase family protein [Chloroflexota bacterium]
MSWRIHPQGQPFALGGALTATLLAALGFKRAAGGAALAGLAAAYFFRDPDRRPPWPRAAVVAPADGKVVLVRQEPEPLWVGGDAWRIAIFMSLTDVHINRAPLDARVVRIRHQPGQYLPAHRDDALARNERRFYCLERDDGARVLLVQVAGLLARRTVPLVSSGEFVARGQRLGLIRFGSRVEVFLPTAAQPLVAQGHRVRAGETPIAWWE